MRGHEHDELGSPLLALRGAWDTLEGDDESVSSARASSSCVSSVPSEFEADLDSILAYWDLLDDHATELSDETESASSCSSDVSPAASPREPCAVVQSEGSAAATVTLPTPSAAATPNPRKYPSTYARQKREISLLRQHAEALEAVVRRMTTPANLALLSTTELQLKRTDHRALAASPSWKHTAESERLKLRQAQRENAALRLAALEQRRMAKSLHHMLARRVASKESIMQHSLMLAPALLTQSSSSGSAMAPANDFALFSGVCRDILALSRSVASAVEVIERKSPDASDFREWRVHHDPDGCCSLEVAYGIEVPFRKADVDQAFQCIRRQPKPNMNRYEPHFYGAPPGVRLTKSVMSCSSASDWNFFRVYHANRTFVGDTRSVTFQVAYIDSAEQGRPIPGGMLKEQQWGVISERTYIDAHTGREAHSTRIRVVSLIAPLSTSGAAGAGWTRQTVEAKVIPVWDVIISLGRQNMENTLIEQQRLAGARFE